jgi:GH43 family beta-xylosidase
MRKSVLLISGISFSSYFWAMTAHGQVRTASPKDGAVLPVSAISSSQGAFFANPVLPAGSFAPWVMKNGEYYHYIRAAETAVALSRTPRLEQVGGAFATVVWRAGKESPIQADIRAPELYQFDGKWYIYASGKASAREPLAIQQLFVLESVGADPLGPYQFKTLLDPGSYATHPTVLSVPAENSRYLVWSQFERDGQALFIAPLVNPWTLGEPKVRISVAQHGWEKEEQAPVNEAPQVLLRHDKTFIVYSAGASWSEFYAMGLLINEDGNYLNPASWRKVAEPVFKKSDRNYVYGVGHASFVKSPDGTEDWMVYHGMSRPDGGQEDGSMRMQQFTWSAEGLPFFGEPVAAGIKLPVPSNRKFQSTK